MAKLCPISNTPCTLTGCVDKCSMNYTRITHYGDTFKAETFNKGWECPKCGNIWSPNSQGCKKCNEK